MTKFPVPVSVGGGLEGACSEAGRNTKTEKVGAFKAKLGIFPRSVCATISNCTVLKAVKVIREKDCVTSSHLVTFDEKQVISTVS